MARVLVVGDLMTVVTGRVERGVLLPNEDVELVGIKEKGFKTKVTAIETANQGVTCNAICPGWVLTALVQTQIEARAAAQGIPYQQAHDDLLREKQPMLQYTTPEKIAGLAVFLCGEAASTMTGAALSIDLHASTTFRVVLAGTNGTSVSVAVAPRVRVQALSAKLLGGKVLPRPSAPVQVWRRLRGTWRVVAHPILNEDGEFMTPLPLRAAA